MPKEKVSFKFPSNMATIDVIRRSDGRVQYPCGNQATLPTNPKAGSPYSANTVRWNPNTRVVALTVPRQNAVNVDTWAPRSSVAAHPSSITYQKPPFRTTTTSPRVVVQPQQLFASPASCPPAPASKR